MFNAIAAVLYRLPNNWKKLWVNISTKTKLMKKTAALIIFLFLSSIPVIKAQTPDHNTSVKPGATLNTNTKDPDSNRLAVTEVQANVCKAVCYPNPATDHIQLNITASATGNYTLTIISINGQKMLQQNIKIMEGNNQQAINLATFPAGLYLLNISSQTGIRQSFSFVRN